MIEDILKYGLDLKEFTVYNFASLNAQDPAGSLNQADRDFKKLVRAEYIKAIPCDIEPQNRRKATFYQITAKGAEAANRREDYHYKERKAVSNIAHDSGVKDLALQFIRLGAKVSFEHPVGEYREGNNTKTMHCDFLAVLNNRRFYVEREIKLDANRTYNDKVKKYENISLSRDSRVLIVWQDTDYNSFLRKQSIEQFKRPELYDYHSKRSLHYAALDKREYGKLDSNAKKQLLKSKAWIDDYKKWREMHRKFAMLLEYMKNVKPIKVKDGKDYYKYRLTTFDNYYAIDKPVWSVPNSENKTPLF